MTQKEALDILKTGANIFLTGEPGSGKTYTINLFINYLKEHGIRPAVTASTGIAATHIGGMTIHSWSGIGIKKMLSAYDIDRIASNRRIVKRIERTQTLIIEEISMLDGKTLGFVDLICKEIKRSGEPFGGMQVIFVGDFFQLPPVSREDEALSEFAFESETWQRASPIVCYLAEQHRQRDLIFLEILTAIRKGIVREEHRGHLASRIDDERAQEIKDLPKLFPHNADVDAINIKELTKLPGEPKFFFMEEKGNELFANHLKRWCLSPEKLELKVGARVMCTKNNPEKGFVNGTLGMITGFDKTNSCPMIRTRGGRIIVVEPMEWTMDENGRALARITQIPLRLAWAMTVHKSQGISLDAAFMDLRTTFVEGQGYVALSRVRTLSGLYLAGFNETALITHPVVRERDNAFREESVAAKEVFSKLSCEELTQMQQNFIRASGGEVKQKGGRDYKKVDKAYSVEGIRTKHANAYHPWNAQEEGKLLQFYQSGTSAKAIARLLGRKVGAITSRLRKLGIV